MRKSLVGLFGVLIFMLGGCSVDKDVITDINESSLSVNESNPEIKKPLRDSEVDKKFLISNEEYLEMAALFEQSTFTTQYLALYGIPEAPMIGSLIANEMYNDHTITNFKEAADKVLTGIDFDLANLISEMDEESNEYLESNSLLSFKKGNKLVYERSKDQSFEVLVEGKGENPKFHVNSYEDFQEYYRDLLVDNEEIDFTKDRSFWIGHSLNPDVSKVSHGLSQSIYGPLHSIEGKVIMEAVMDFLPEDLAIVNFWTPNGETNVRILYLPVSGNATDFSEGMITVIIRNLLGYNYDGYAISYQYIGADGKQVGYENGDFREGYRKDIQQVKSEIDEFIDGANDPTYW